MTTSSTWLKAIPPGGPLFRGQATLSASRDGWLDAVHPDDRDIATTFLRDAHTQQTEYSFRHRLRRADGSYVWVAGGAVPSFGPPGRTFLGYLGSLTEIAPSGSERLTAYGTLERFIPPPSHPATTPSSALELVADHLLIAHGLIEQDHAKEMLPVLRAALFVAGQLLARKMTSGGSRDRFH